MSRIKIMTDSGSDILAREEMDYGIQVIPFPVAFGDKTYLSRVDFDNQDFYKLLEASEELPTTSQITVYQYGEYFEALYREGYTHVINITINGEGSGTYNSACLAAQMFFESHPEAKDTFFIHNVDGRTYSYGYGYAVAEAARMAKAGKEAEEILDFLRDWLEHCVIYFVPFTLKYAARSGRIPSAAAFVGELVGLKPVMRIEDGVIQTNDKVRGEKKALAMMISKTASEMKPGTPYVVMYGSRPELGDQLEKAMVAAVGYPPVNKLSVGAVISINSGPDVAGILFRT